MVISVFGVTESKLSIFIMISARYVYIYECVDVCTIQLKNLFMYNYEILYLVVILYVDGNFPFWLKSDDRKGTLLEAH